MKKYKITWGQVPLNFNTHRVAIVAAANEGAAKEILRDSWEVKLGISRNECSIISCIEYLEPKYEGHVISMG